MLRSHPLIRFSALLALLLGNTTLCASDSDKDEVFARMGDSVITQKLLDGAFSRINERDRLMYIRDEKRVNDLVQKLMTNRRLADAARSAGFDEDPLVAARLEVAVDKELAEAWLDEQVRKAPKADYEQLALEHFRLNREQYTTPFMYDVTHLLISTEERAEQEAEELAEALLVRVRSNPEQFDELVREYSEDPSVSSNQGRFSNVQLGRLVAPFEVAALALDGPGDISDLVRSRFGFHIIRLDGKHPERQLEFEEVKDRLIARQKVEYDDIVRRRLIGQAIAEPLESPEGAVEEMLRRHFGDNFELVPDYSN